MSIRAKLRAYIIANPGQTIRQIAAGVGLTGRAEITNAGAQLSQLVKLGKLRAEVPPPRVRGACYYPTATTGKNARGPSTPEISAALKRARNQRKTERRRAQAAAKRALSQAQREAFYGTDLPAPAPLPASAPATRVGITISRKPLVVAKTRFNASAEPETVEEWMRRTGKQPERLPPHACGRSVLRFDHSDNTVPTGRRRPALRVRGAHRT